MTFLSSATQLKHCHGMVSVLQNHFSCISSTLGHCFVSSQSVLCRPRTQTRIVFFLVERISIPNLEQFPDSVRIQLSRQKDDRTAFTQEERLGLPCGTINFGHLCFGRRVQKSGQSDFGILNNDAASSFFLGVTHYCV